jgi:hypothetical protein
MRQWEYLRLDLNDIPRRGDETVALNKAGDEGWEARGRHPEWISLTQTRG